MRRKFRWPGALLSAVVLATTIQTVAPGAVQAAVLPDTGWGGILSYRDGDPTVDGQVFDIHWTVSPALVAPDTVRFPNPTFTQRGSWQLDYTNRGTDFCDSDQDGVIEQYPWTQTGHNTGAGNVTVKYSDATHYIISTSPDGGSYKVTFGPGNTTPCGTQPGGDAALGFFTLPVSGLSATDASGYTHISGNDVNGIASGTWSLSRTNVTNIAGYELTSGPQTSASAAFTIPALTCPTRGARGILPGAWLGSAAPTAAYAEVLCRNGVPVYGAGAWLNGTRHRFAMTPQPGDQMTVSVIETAAASVAKITDVTQQTSATARSGGGTQPIAIIGDVGLVTSGKLQGVPPFGTITFRSARANGHAIGAGSSQAVNRMTVLGTLQIRTGPLNSAGTSFTTTFKHQ